MVRGGGLSFTSLPHLQDVVVGKGGGRPAELFGRSIPIDLGMCSLLSRVDWNKRSITR